MHPNCRGPVRVDTESAAAMIHQIQYRFKKPPSGARVAEVRALWLAGKPTPGAVVSAVAWSRAPGDTRAAVETGYVGRAGLVKCYARADWSMCDYDTKKPPSMESIWRICRMLGIAPRWVRYDRTRRGWHLIIEWTRKFRPIETVAIQQALGSDLQREAFNLARVFSGKARNRRWNILFERKIT